VPRFLAGFALASLVWLGALLGGLWLGVFTIDLTTDPPAADDATAQVPVAEKNAPDKRKKRATRPAREGRRLSGESTAGDELGPDGIRNLDLNNQGGEEQLLDREIEQAFDRSFPQIRRCLSLAAGDEPVRGTLTFGLRISGREGITRVNLNGPSAITQSEAGECLHKAVRAMHLRSFNGPDMVVHYPLTLN
jgi:hypothetical protein